MDVFPKKVQRQELHEFFRTDACPLGEHPLKMLRRQMYLPGNFGEVGLLPEVFSEILDGDGDAFVIEMLLAHVLFVANFGLLLRDANPEVAVLNNLTFKP